MYRSLWIQDLFITQAWHGLTPFPKISDDSNYPSNPSITNLSPVLQDHSGKE